MKQSTPRHGRLQAAYTQPSCLQALPIELNKCKRTGIVPLMLAMGILGAAYAFANFAIRKNTLLSLPMAPMDILLTQVYGMIMVLNMFGIIVAACIMYAMEFRGGAVKKLHMLPVSMSYIYLCKFLILTALLLVAVCLQQGALAIIGASDLPQGTFDVPTLLVFAGYSFLTSMPVLSFMLFAASRFENMWVPLGIGVVGFLSGMALAPTGLALCMALPFVVMLQPAVAMSAAPTCEVVIPSLVETALFIWLGAWTAQHVHYE